eukprot:1011733_1
MKNMLGVDEKYDIYEGVPHIKNGKISQIYHSEETLELKSKVLHLETWKREIGITAVEEVDQLKYELLEIKEKMKQQDIEMLTLKQENDSLEMQLETFQEEHDKWQIEKEELISQLDGVTTERNAVIIEEEHWAHSVKEQYHTIDGLTVRNRRSSTDLLESQRTISELLQDNQQLRSDNNQLKILNNQNIETITNIKQKLNDTENKLIKLQKKYDSDTALYLNEKEKLQGTYQDLIKDQVIEKEDTSEAHPIAFNPVPSNKPDFLRKRS